MKVKDLIRVLTDTQSIKIYNAITLDYLGNEESLYNYNNYVVEFIYSYFDDGEKRTFLVLEIYEKYKEYKLI